MSDEQMQAALASYMRIHWGKTGNVFFLAALESAYADAWQASRTAQSEAKPVVKWEIRMRPTWDKKNPWTDWVECSEGAAMDSKRNPVFNDFEYEVRALGVISDATPAPVKPADQYCQTCGGSGDVHTIDGEWRGECPVCKDAAIGAGDAEASRTAPDAEIYQVTSEDSDWMDAVKAVYDDWPKHARRIVYTAPPVAAPVEVMDALAGWQFRREKGERYWVVLTPTGRFALANDAADERSCSCILAELAAALAHRGEKT